MTQFCIEEAVMERLYWDDRLAAARRVDQSGGLDVVSPFDAAGAAHAAAMVELGVTG